MDIESPNLIPSIGQLLRQLWCHISSPRRRQLAVLLVLMICVSFAEIISIGAVLPFLAVLTAPERIFSLPAAAPVIEFFNLTKPSQLLLPITISFCFAAFISGAMRLTLLWVSTRLSFAIGADFSIDIYRRTLYQPYVVHCARNSSEVIGAISVKVDRVIFSVLIPVLTIISSSTLFVAILGTLSLINPIATFAALSSFGMIYFGITLWTRKKLLIDSMVMARESTQVIKSLQEGLGGIRDVLIDGSQEVYCQSYKHADKAYRLAQARSSFIGFGPRYFIETLGIILIALFAYSLTGGVDGVSGTIPLLGVLALGGQRLLPVLQQAFGSWAQIQSAQVSLNDALKLINQPLPDLYQCVNIEPLPFKRDISLNKIGFRYGEQLPYIFRGLDLKIIKGGRIGFIGTTGSGKSTLLDIVMGLLMATEGSLAVDGVEISSSNKPSWQSHIAHVPQTIFLADGSIEENIAFGVPKNKIDYLRVQLVAEQAKIADVIEGLPKKYKTFVGERGVRLSGGQRQRIGIARALYKQADVIFFDEATSALDSETEQAVMQTIEGLHKDLTILIIAHRLDTLKNCTQIVELSEGRIQRVGNYEEIVSNLM